MKYHSTHAGTILAYRHETWLRHGQRSTLTQLIRRASPNHGGDRDSNDEHGRTIAAARAWMVDAIADGKAEPGFRSRDRARDPALRCGATFANSAFVL